MAVERILALDQATTSGFCFGAIGGSPTWGSIKFRGEGNGAIFAEYRSWLVQMVAQAGPTIVVFESPFIPHNAAPRFGKGGKLSSAIPMNPLTLRRLLYMAGCIEEVCSAAGVRCREVTPAEVTKFILNRVRMNRNEKKAETLRVIRAYGFDVADDNCADAVAIWLKTEATLSPALASRRGEGPLFQRSI